MKKDPHNKDLFLSKHNMSQITLYNIIISRRDLAFNSLCKINSQKDHQILVIFLYIT